MDTAGFFSPIRVLVFFVSLALPALFILPSLKVDLLPVVADSTIQISVRFPQASPFSVERGVIAPLENALSVVRGLKTIRSESRYEQGSISLVFSRKEDLSALRFEVSSILRNVFPKLPEGVSYPQIGNRLDRNLTSSESPSLVYSIEGEGNIAHIRQQAESFFRQALLNEEELTHMLFQGGQEEVIAVEFDPQALQNYDLSTNDLQQSIQHAFGNRFLGVIRDALDRVLFIRTLPYNLNTEALQNTLIPRNGANPIRIKQVAQVYHKWEEPQYFFRINGRNAVSVELFLSADCNKIYEVSRIQKRLIKAAQSQKKLHIHLEQDYTAFLREEIHKSWVRVGASILILLGVLLLTYRQLRLLAILLFCLLINIALTLLISWAFGVKWHTYTLAGFSVAFGLIIDNAIVMLDSYRRKLNRRIYMALLGATLTTASALLLVFFLPSEQQQNLMDFAVIIVFSLFSSLLSVLFLVPACYDLWVGYSEQLRPKKIMFVKKRRLWNRLIHYRALISFFGRWRVLFCLAWVLFFGFPVFLIPTEVKSPPSYLHWINTNTFQREIRPHLEFWLGGSIQLFTSNFQEENYYRYPEETGLFVRAELPHGHTLQQMNNLMTRFEVLLRQQKGISSFSTSVYSGQFGNLEIHFTKAAKKSNFPLRIQSLLQELAQSFSGVQWNIYGTGENFSNNLFLDNRANSRLILKGYDYQELELQAKKLGKILSQNIRVQNITTDKNINYSDRPLPEIYLHLDETKLAQHKTGMYELLSALAKKTTATYVSIQSEKERSNIVIRAKNAQQYDVNHLLNDPVKSKTAGTRVGEVGQLKLQQSSSTIYRENRQYLRLVTYEYIGSYDLAKDLQQKTINKMNQEMPLGYSVELGQGNISAEAKQQFFLLLILLVLNFFICAILFENLKQPFFIMLTVPISFIGVFLSFAYGAFIFDQGGFAAFVMLGGIVVNASIFVINDLNNASGRYSNIQSTIIKVLYRRSRTILLTIISTICGFVPFLYEGPDTPFWFALAVGTIGGLLMSVFAVFLVLPVLLWKNN